MTTIHRGGCFCGAIAIEATGDPVEMGHCHCASCRAYSGNPFAAFTLWPDEAIRVTKGEEHLGSVNRTGLTDRRFCTSCGGHLMAYHPGFGFTDVLAGVLLDLDFRPMLHLHYAAVVLPLRDGLPKLKDLPAHAGGTGEFLPE